MLMLQQSQPHLSRVETNLEIPQNTTTKAPAKKKKKSKYK